MKHLIHYILLLVICCSCDKGDLPTTHMGEVSYYPTFLFWEADTTSLTKTFAFDFNDDAKSEGANSCITFEFVDNNGKPVPTNELEIKVDGNKLCTNQFTVNSNDCEKNLTFTFLPAAESGKHQGTLRVAKHNLIDRIDNQIIDDDNVDVIKWTINFNKCWNPLAVILTWIGIVLLAAFILWMSIFKSVFYPRFRAIRKSIIIPSQAPIVVNFKGARMVVLDKVKHKQSLWNRMWTGTIVYKQNSALTSAITLMPTGKGKKILFKADATNYICTPNPIDLQPSRVKDIANNQHITIQ